MTQLSRHSSRALGAGRRAPKITTKAAAKTATGLGLVVGASALLATPSATSAAPKEPTAQVSAAAQADAMLEGRGSTAAQRSTARTAVSAPAQVPPPLRESTADAGELGITAVAKPKPKPKPQPAPQAAEPSTSSQASGRSGSTPASSSAGPAASAAPPAAPAAPAPSSVNTTGFSAQASAIGLGPNASGVYSAVRTQFPSVTNIGGYRAGDPGDHGTGRAVDIMVTGSSGDAIASYLQANAGRLNIKYLIWKQRYWQPGSSWRFMEDRGSATANHYDHVHVSVN